MNTLRVEDFAALRDRLAGRVVEPGDGSWDEARTAWNLTADQHPAAVVVAASAEDIVETVRFAFDNGYGVTAQGTGHGAAALTSRLDGVILIKTHEMRGVEIDPETRTARAQAGALWMDVTVPCPRARPGRPGRIVARRGRGRLHPRRRSQLAQPHLRGGREQRHGDRGRDRRRPGHPHRRGQRSGAVLGAARRRRQLRHRHRDRVHALPGAGGLRRRHVLADRAGRRGAARVARPRAVAAGVDDDRRPAADAAADPGHPGAPARTQVRGGRGHPPRRRAGGCRAAGAAARARARDGHDRHHPDVGAVGAAHGSGAPGARCRRRHAAGRASTPARSTRSPAWACRVRSTPCCLSSCASWAGRSPGPRRARARSATSTPRTPCTPSASRRCRRPSRR